MSILEPTSLTFNAVGDITDWITLTDVGLMEGHRLADTLYGGMSAPEKASIRHHHGILKMTRFGFCGYISFCEVVLMWKSEIDV
jgi:hypothetical protein